MASLNVFSLLAANKKTALLATVLPILFTLYGLSKKTPPRVKKVPKRGERVLILGATSGVGQAMAHQYARRGARVCVVGRRQALVQQVVDECRREPMVDDDCIFGSTGDFADVEDMVRVREDVLQRWNGLDTLVVCAGVSALQPLLAVAGAPKRGSELGPTDTTKESIQKASDVSLAAIRGNYTGPLVAATTFIPVLSSTSRAGAIVLISSVAALVPAPTRTIYASTKAAGLVLYQALSIEHPQVAFSHILPGTIEGDFRASAVDQGPVREQDPNKHGLKRDYVARKSIEAADYGKTAVWMPFMMRVAHALYWIVPSVIDRFAAKKYNFET